MAAIDQPLVVQAHECGPHSAHVVRIHREHVARPVGRRAQLAHLGVDDVAIGFHPLAHLVQELLAAQIVAIKPSGLQVPLDHELSRDTRVIPTGHPQARIAQHAVPANHHIFQGHEQRVAVV